MLGSQRSAAPLRAARNRAPYCPYEFSSLAGMGGRGWYRAHHKLREAWFERTTCTPVSARLAIVLIAFGTQGMHPPERIGAGITAYGMPYHVPHDELVHHSWPLVPCLPTSLEADLLSSSTHRWPATAATAGVAQHGSKRCFSDSEKAMQMPALMVFHHSTQAISKPEAQVLNLIFRDGMPNRISAPCHLVAPVLQPCARCLGHRERGDVIQSAMADKYGCAIGCTRALVVELRHDGKPA